MKELVRNWGYFTERYVWAVWLFTTQKPISRPGWWKEKFALFQMLATGGRGVREGGGHLSWFKGWLSPTPWQAGAESIYRQSLVGGLPAETAESSLTVIFKLIISALTSIILVVSGTISFQFQGALVPTSLQSVLRIAATQVLGTVWSSCT